MAELVRNNINNNSPYLPNRIITNLRIIMSVYAIVSELNVPIINNPNLSRKSQKELINIIWRVSVTQRPKKVQLLLPLLLLLHTHTQTTVHISTHFDIYIIYLVIKPYNYYKVYLRIACLGNGDPLRQSTIAFCSASKEGRLITTQVASSVKAQLSKEELNSVPSGLLKMLPVMQHNVHETGSKMKQKSAIRTITYALFV